MKKTLIAIDPAGVKHKRTTERTYTHIVVARRSKEYALQSAQTKWMHFDSNFWYHQAFIDGTSKWLERKSWETDESYAKRVSSDVERAKKANRGCSTPEELWEIVKAEQVAAADAADYSKWHALGWCGRRDLAEKLACGAGGGKWAEVVILPVE